MFFIFIIANTSAIAAAIDCSIAYGKAAQCERIACSKKYKSFIGKWTGTFQSYSQELSTESAVIFRPFQNEIIYDESDCLKNVVNGDTFIIGKRTDRYPAFQGLPSKVSKGLLITGSKSDGIPFLKTSDEEGFNEYTLLYQNNAAVLSVWELVVPASTDGKTPEMRFTTVDGQDFLEQGNHKRNVTVTMSLGPKQNPVWEAVIVKGFHSLEK